MSQTRIRQAAWQALAFGLALGSGSGSIPAALAADPFQEIERRFQE